MNNMNDIMNLCQRLRQDPVGMLSARFNIPRNVNLTNPNDIIQHLLNTGQVTQSQVNQIMNSPVIKQFMR